MTHDRSVGVVVRRIRKWMSVHMILGSKLDYRMDEFYVTFSLDMAL